MNNFNKVHILLGLNKQSCIIGFYLDNLKIKQMYMMDNISLKEWFPKQSKIWRTKFKAKVTISRL